MTVLIETSVKFQVSHNSQQTLLGNIKKYKITYFYLL